jgi:hypothetical protein
MAAMSQYDHNSPALKELLQLLFGQVGLALVYRLWCTGSPRFDRRARRRWRTTAEHAQWPYYPNVLARQGGPRTLVTARQGLRAAPKKDIWMAQLLTNN